MSKSLEKPEKTQFKVLEKPEIRGKILLEKPKEGVFIMFYRKIETELYEYYNDTTAKIIVINGARQIGKSYIIRKTASSFFKNYIEINLKSDFEGEQIFKSIKKTKDFYLQLSALYGEKLNNNTDTIIFLDEIQVYPHLLTMLKDLKHENKYRYIASGSLLGITLKHTFIPMGSINEIKMYPMDFEEFLYANKVGKDVIEYLKECFESLTTVTESIHKTILEKFKEYLICGGLPDSVKEMVIKNNVLKVRENQSLTYNYYKDDASQYDQEHLLKIRRIYELMPSYMENKVKRIKFKQIENIDDSNLLKYKDEFDYLVNSGCALGVKAISDPRFPLIESNSKNLIKLYFNDVGILTNILYKNNISAILNNDKAINLGSVYETAVANELIAHGHELFYFDSKKVGEVDFLINDYNNLSILPIEIKSGKNNYEYRAIPKLVDKNGNYKLNKGYIFTNNNTCKSENDLYTFPIYLVMFI